MDSKASNSFSFPLLLLGCKTEFLVGEWEAEVARENPSSASVNKMVITINLGVFSLSQILLTVCSNEKYSLKWFVLRL